MDDLSERDLSSVADEDLTPEERQELTRRMDEFLERMQLRRPDKEAVEAKPKQIMSWDPVAIARRH